jgi:HEAT repeat protein
METATTDIWALVARLNNLHEIFRVQGEILVHGQAAVEPLVALLLSPPSTFPQPRVAAAECLGAIGSETAIDALIRVLDYNNLQALGPVQRLAEETVRNAAARQLGKFPFPHVIDALLAALKRDHLIEAGVTLAQLGEKQAIPALLECLEDDVKKEKATDALRCFGAMVVPSLEDALRHPRLVEGVEPPLSEERRTRAALLLGDLGAREVIPTLRERLRDDSHKVRLECALALVVLLGKEAQEAVPLLIEGLAAPDFLMQTRCEEAVQAVKEVAVPGLVQAAQGLPLTLPSGAKARVTLRGRLAAIRLLGKCGGQEVLAPLCALLHDPEERIRGEVILVLRRFSDPQVQAVLEDTARHDPSKAVRFVARTAVEQQRGKRRLLQAVSRHLRFWRHA